MKKIFNDLDMFKREVGRIVDNDYLSWITLYVKNDRKKVWAMDAAEQIIAVLELTKAIDKEDLVEVYRELVPFLHSETENWEQRMYENVIFVKDIKW